jgi:DNA-binding winged helix-turn-helix (wHTH) protein
VIHPPYAAPFPDMATPPVLGAQHRAMLTALAQRPGKVVSRETLADRVGRPTLTPRRADDLAAAITRALGEEVVIVVPRRGWMLQRYDVNANVTTY